jgi:hypothetical protein
MTINYITRLNKALIQSGYINKKVKLRLINNKITADLFCLVFKLIQKDVALSKDV